MAEMVGGAFLTAVFNKLHEQLASLKVKLGTNFEGLKLETLEKKLNEASVYMDDAEDWQLFDQRVKEWLDDLMHVVFMAEELVEQIKNFGEEKNPERKDIDSVDFSKSVYQSLAKTFQGEIDLIWRDLERLLERAIVLELKHVSSRSSPTTVAPLREEHHVYGREAEKEEILKMLLSEEDEMIVLPIVGMGGLGKTTLAQLVYDDKRVEEHNFSLKAWVTVSTEFDFCKIMKELLQKVNPGASSSDPNELQLLMKEGLRGKKFLFVLDDVWEEDYSSWDLLMSNFTAGDPRSRVIVTTRSRDVGSMVKTGTIHELKEVQKDDCWSIFVHHAFNGDTDADPELQVIGKRIVEKCKGLPLAVRCLGSLLRSERSSRKWEDILGRNWSKVMENEVLLPLWLSYRDLSPTRKQCFVYCSLFPKSYKFYKIEIIFLWMAEGFIRSEEEGKSMEEVGEEYFDDLVSRSLFQRSSDHYEETYVVHDLVHDLAAFVYGKFFLRIGDDDFKNVTFRTRHLTDNKYVSSYPLLTSLSTSKHLRTLMNIQASPTSDFVDKMVKEVRCLRVITISLPRSVLCHSLGDLKMLRYLNLSGSEIEELPDSICSLPNLQTLNLSRCKRLTRLPINLAGKLSKLRHLDTNSTGLTKLPPKIRSLKELRVLTQFVLGEGDGSVCSTLKELGELHHLGGHLGISQLQNVDDLEDVQKANLIDKAEMKVLCLEWKGDTGDMIDKAIDVLDALQPHNNLEKLELVNYPGSSFPKWVGERSFSKMVYVFLNGGRSSALPPLGQLPSLRGLHIWRFEEVEKIGKEFLYGNDTNPSITPFPSLEILTFGWMSNWKEWSFVGNESACFPGLKQLDISFCPKLESIISIGPEMESTKLQHWPSLCQLDIIECPLLERRYQKDRGEHWHYISHILKIYIRDRTTDGRKTGSTTNVELSDELEREGEETRQDEQKSESHITETNKTGSTIDDLETADRAVLTAVFEKLIKQLASLELRTNSVSSKLKMLEEKLEKVRVYVDDAEDKKLSDNNVEEWLDQLKHVIFMADDLVEQINNCNEEKSPERKDRKDDDSVEFFKSVYHSLAKTVQDLIDLILTDLEGLYDRARGLELKHISTSAVQKMATKMGSLKELHPLGGKLRISRLQNVQNLEDVQKPNLRDKEEMKELNLEWDDNDTSNMILAVDVLDALQPHKKLEKLSVYGYPGPSFPNWVGETSFSELASVELEVGTSHFLPPLGQLPSLRQLRIECFKKVEKIGNEFLYGNDNSSIAPFPSLETLSFGCMPRWKEWSFDGNESCCFPRLKQLQLRCCPKLESIITEDDRPERESTKLNPHWPSLSQLTIFDCPLLEKRYQKYKGDRRHYISHIPEIYITGSVTGSIPILESSDGLEREEEKTRRGEENSKSILHRMIKNKLIIYFSILSIFSIFLIFINHFC